MINELKKVGKVLHLSNLTKSILIIRLNEPLRIGTIIYDEKMRELGPIIELFGPVDKPYARVKLKDSWISSEIKQVLGRPCYVVLGDEVPVKWRKKPKRRSKIE